MSELKVYLIGRQILDAHEIRRFCDDEGVQFTSDAPSPAERLVEFAGRLCYMSYNNPRPGGNAAYVQHLLEVGHGSVLEHANWTFILTGISRSLTHELIRHRAGFAYSELSQRYVDQSLSKPIVPPVMRDDPECYWSVIAGHYAARQRYKILVDKLMVTFAHLGKTEARKAARGAARAVLPECTETKITVTANARALRHFFEQRASRHADAEIRRLAVEMWRKVVAEAPNLFGDYKIVELPDGSIALDTEWRKV